MPLRNDTLSYSHEITVRGNLDYYGTSVQNDIISKFIRGGQITEENKDNSFDRHKAINRLGGIGEGEIEYRNYRKQLFKNKGWGSRLIAYWVLMLRWWLWDLWLVSATCGYRLFKEKDNAGISRLRCIIGY